MLVAVLPKPKNTELVEPVVNGPSYNTRDVPELVAVGTGVAVGVLVAVGVFVGVGVFVVVGGFVGVGVSVPYPYCALTGSVTVNVETIQIVSTSVKTRMYVRFNT
jgi:acyl-[acyl carrier protein]--UDP-N-acetylglucosamine O-acyltransferase